MVHSSSKPQLTEKDLPPLQELVGRGWVTIEQMATIVDKSYRTVRAWVVADPPKVASTKVGGQYRIYEAELRRFLEHGNLPTQGIDRNIESQD